MARQTPTPSPPPPSASTARSNRTVTAATNRAAVENAGTENGAGVTSSEILVGAAGTVDGGGARSQSSPESNGCGRGPAVAGGNTGHPTYLEDHVARMQAEIERTTRRLEIEKRRLHELGESSRKAQHEYQDKRLRYSFNKAGAQEERLKAENNVLQLENRLSQALCKLNSGSDDINKLKALIDNYRKERLAMEKVYRHVHRELAHHTEYLTLAKEKVVQLQEWEHQSTRRMDELNKAREHERELFKQHCLTMQKELREQDRQIKEFDIRTHRESSMQRSQVKGSPYSLAEDEHTFNPENLMKLIFKTALLNAVHRHNIRQYKHKISVFEKAMESIKTSTGISHAEEIVSIFSQLEERNYSVMTYVNNINVELEYLETKKRQLEMHMRQQAHHDATAQRLTDETLRDVAIQISNTLLATEGKNALIQRQLQGLQQSHEMLEATTSLIRSCWKGPHTSEEPPPRDPGPFGPNGQKRDLLPMLWFIQKFFERHKDLLYEAKNETCIVAAISAAHAWANSHAAAAAQAAGSGAHATAGSTLAALPAVHPSGIRHASNNTPYIPHGPGDSVGARLSEKAGSSGTSRQGGVASTGTTFVRGRSSPVGFGAIAGGGAGTGASGVWGRRTTGRSSGVLWRGNNSCSAVGASRRKTTCPAPGSHSSHGAHAPAAEPRPGSGKTQRYARGHLFQQVFEKIEKGRRSPTQPFQGSLSAVTSFVTTDAAAASAAGACSDEAATGAGDSGITRRCATADSCTETSAEAARGMEAPAGDRVTSGIPRKTAENMDRGTKTKAPAQSGKTPSEEEEDEERELDSGDERSLVPKDVVPLSSEELRERTIHLFNRMRKKKAASEANTQPLTLYLPEKRCLLASPGTRAGLASLSPLFAEISDNQMLGTPSGDALLQLQATGAFADAALVAALTEQRTVDGEQEGACEREAEAGSVAGSDHRPAQEEAGGEGTVRHAIEDQQPAQAGRSKPSIAESAESTAPAEEGSQQSQRLGEAVQKKKTLPRFFERPTRVLFCRRKEKRNSGADAPDARPGVSPASPSRTSLTTHSQQQQQQKRPSQDQQQTHHSSDAEKKPSITLTRDISLWGRRKSTKRLADRSGARGSARTTYELQGQLPPLRHPQQPRNERLKHALSLRSSTRARRKSSNAQEWKVQQQQVADCMEAGQKRDGEGEGDENENDGGEPQKEQESEQILQQPVHDAGKQEVLQQGLHRRKRQEQEARAPEEQEQQQPFQEPLHCSEQPCHLQQQKTDGLAVVDGLEVSRIKAEDTTQLLHSASLQRSAEEKGTSQVDQKYVRRSSSSEHQDGEKVDAPYKEDSSDKIFRTRLETKVKVTRLESFSSQSVRVPEEQCSRQPEPAPDLDRPVADHSSDEETDTRTLANSVQEQQMELQRQQENCCSKQQLPLACREQNRSCETQQHNPSSVGSVKEIPSSLSVVLRQIPAKSLEPKEEYTLYTKQQSSTEELSPSGMVRFIDSPEAGHEETAAPHNEAADLVRRSLPPMREERKAALATPAETHVSATQEHDTKNLKIVCQSKFATLEKVKEEKPGEGPFTKSCGMTGTSNGTKSDPGSSIYNSDTSSTGIQNIPFDLGRRKSATVLAALWERCETLAAEEMATGCQGEQRQQRTRQTSESDNSRTGGLENIPCQSYIAVREPKEYKKADVCTEFLQPRKENASASEAARGNLLTIREKALVQLDSMEETKLPLEVQAADLKQEQGQQIEADASGSPGKSFYASSPFSFLPENRGWNLSNSMSSSSPAASNSPGALAKASKLDYRAAGPPLPTRPREITKAQTSSEISQIANVDEAERTREEGSEKSRPDLDDPVAKDESLQHEKQGQGQHHQTQYLAHAKGAAANTENAKGSNGSNQRPEPVASGALPPRPSSGPAGQSNAVASSPVAPFFSAHHERALSTGGFNTPVHAKSLARPHSPLPATVAAAAFQALHTATLSSSTVGADGYTNGISARISKRRPGSASGGLERRFSAIAATSARPCLNSAGPRLSGAATDGLSAVCLSSASSAALEPLASCAPLSAAARAEAPPRDVLSVLSQPAACSDVGGCVAVAQSATSVAGAGAAVDEVTAAACVPLGKTAAPRTPAAALQASGSPVPQAGTSATTGEGGSLTCIKNTEAGKGIALRPQQGARSDSGTTAKDSEVALVERGTQKLVRENGKVTQDSRGFSRAIEGPRQHRRLVLQQLQVTEPGDCDKSVPTQQMGGMSPSDASRSEAEMTVPAAPPTGTKAAACRNTSTTGESVLIVSASPGACHVDQLTQNVQSPEGIVWAGFLDTSCRPCTAPPGVEREAVDSLPARTPLMGSFSAMARTVAEGARRPSQLTLSSSSLRADSRPQSRGGALGSARPGAAPLPREKVAAAAAALTASSGSSVGRPVSASPSGTLTPAAAAALYGGNISYTGTGVQLGVVSGATLAVLRQRSTTSNSDLHTPTVGAALNADAVSNVLAASNGGLATPSATAEAAAGVESQNLAFRRPSSPAAVLAAVAAGVILNSRPSSPAQRETSGSSPVLSQQTLWRPGSLANTCNWVGTEGGANEQQQGVQQQKLVSADEEEEQNVQRPPHGTVQNVEKYASVKPYETNYQVQLQQQGEVHAQRRGPQEKQQDDFQSEQKRMPREPGLALKGYQDVKGGGATAAETATEPCGKAVLTSFHELSQPLSPSPTCTAPTYQSPTQPALSATSQDQDEQKEENLSSSSFGAGQTGGSPNPTEIAALPSNVRAGVATSTPAAAAAAKSKSDLQNGFSFQAETEAQPAEENSSGLAKQHIQQMPAKLDTESQQMHQSTAEKSSGLSCVAEELEDLLIIRENELRVQQTGTQQVERETKKSSGRNIADGHVPTEEAVNSLLPAQRPLNNMSGTAELNSSDAQQHGEPRDGPLRREISAEAAPPRSAFRGEEERNNVGKTNGDSGSIAARPLIGSSPDSETTLDGKLAMSSSQPSAETGEQEVFTSFAAPPSVDGINTDRGDVFGRSSACGGTFLRPATAFPTTCGSLAAPLQSEEHKRPASVGSKHVSLDVDEVHDHGDEKEHVEQQQHPHWQQSQSSVYGQQRRSRQSQYTRRSHMSLLSSNRRSTRLSNAEWFQFSPPDLQPPETDSPPGTPPSSSYSRPQTAPNLGTDEPVEEEAFSAVVEGSRFVARVSRVERLTPQQLTKIDEEE